MFNSQKINNDPAPFELPQANGNHVRFPNRSDFSPITQGIIHAPRPEYDNNPNPILELFREGRTECALAEDARDYLRAMSVDQWVYASDQANIEVNTFAVERGATPAHIDHARKVLERLASLEGESQ